jgi:hypothetical protein
MDNVEIFYGHLEYFTVIRDILRPLGTFYGNLVEHFFRFWDQEKSGNPEG